MNDNIIAPIHPGEHLVEFLEELGISQYRLAKTIGVPPRRINEIVHGRRSVTADTALRIGQALGMTPRVLAQSAKDVRPGRCPKLDRAGRYRAADRGIAPPEEWRERPRLHQPRPRGRVLRQAGHGFAAIRLRPAFRRPRRRRRLRAAPPRSRRRRIRARRA